MRNQLKKAVIALIALPVFGIILFSSNSATVSAGGEDADIATVYKAKCAMCHGQKAEKKFDATKADDQLAESVIKGIEGPPKMPSYEKSFSPDQAKALIAYMKSLKQ